MLKFIFRKIINKKWMFLALLIGNILLSAICCSNPMYANAVMQRMLDDDLENYIETKNAYPGTITITFSGSQKRMHLLAEYETLAHSLPEKLGVKAINETAHYHLPLSATRALIEREDIISKSAMLGTMTNLPAHARITAGRMYSDQHAEDGTVEVIVSQQGLIEMNLLLNEKREFSKLTDREGKPLVVEVVGVYEVSDPSDIYWVRNPSAYRSEFLMDTELFSELFMSEGSEFSINATWYEQIDITQMRSDKAEHMYNIALESRDYADDFTYLSMSFNYEALLKDHLAMCRKVSVTLWVLQVPIYILLAAFIFMVSSQILETEASEISVLKSRGVRNRQLVGIYILQSALIALVSILAGIPLGSFITQVLGSANAFLEFVSRKALPVEIGPEAVAYALAAALVSVLAMVLPVRKYARASIVIQKQKKNRRPRPFWQRTFMDVIALGVSLYGLYSFNGQKAALAQRILSGETPDPLLFLSSSMFIIGSGLVAIRLIPLLISAVFHLCKRLWSPAVYASFLKVLRQRANQDFIMIFLVMTIALGVFNAQTASTINQNAEENIRYLTGADIVLRDAWASNSQQVAEDPSLDLIYYEPDFGVYQTMEGIENLAKVFRSSTVSISVKGGSLKNVNLMAIDTDDFGRTAWFDTTLLPTHWYNYLNAMAQNARAVIVSKNFMTQYGYEVGDVISYSFSTTENLRGIIYGFVDYWPGYAPFSYKKGTDGLFREQENFLIVANLSQVQDVIGVRPYDIWIKNENGPDYIYDYSEREGKTFAAFADVENEIVNAKNNPMTKSLNGVLTVGFIVVLVLCFIGFLMYWILSIRQRTLQFGIYRAMGMSMREIFTMLIHEQLCISVVSIVIGGAIGFAAAVLYMPLIQLAYASSDNALPLRNALNPEATGQLFALVGVMLLICMTVLIVIIRRMKIAQALKLGED